MEELTLPGQIEWKHETDLSEKISSPILNDQVNYF